MTGNGATHHTTGTLTTRYSDGTLQNGIGIDDYLALCDRIGMQPAITLRMQFGDLDEVQEAADWVE